ncbi:MAG TPA: MarR family transcriptional regulator [Streptosporangiaceae bacterium]|jgi:DNA-binding transcriptional regulator GbsR (MarR family)
MNDPDPRAPDPRAPDASTPDASGPDASGPDGGALDAAAQGRDEDALYRFIERFSSSLAEAGFPRMPARVFVALLCADSGTRTAAELADMLHASPAAVSGAVRYLTQAGLASSEREPGSRRLRYRTPDNIWHEIMRMRTQLLQRWISVLRDGVQTLGADTRAGQRLSGTARYFELLSSELPVLLARWHEVEGIPDDPG